VKTFSPTVVPPKILRAAVAVAAVKSSPPIVEAPMAIKASTVVEAWRSAWPKEVESTMLLEYRPAVTTPAAVIFKTTSLVTVLYT
jgi:hypothetical protein